RLSASVGSGAFSACVHVRFSRIWKNRTKSRGRAVRIRCEESVNPGKDNCAMGHGNLWCSDCRKAPTMFFLFRRTKSTRNRFRPSLETLGERILPATFGGLGDLPGGRVFSNAIDVSADGLVVVGDSYSSRGREAYRWTPSTGMEGL